jgi:ligand-binding sensor domain-containing protein
MNKRMWAIFGMALITLLTLQSALVRPVRAELGGEWRNYTFDKDINALALDGNILWAGTWGGVLRWDLTAGTYTKFTLVDGLADNFIYDLAIDNLHRVWVATDSGLSMFNGVIWTTYDNTNSPIPGDSVHLVATSSDNRVWLHSRSINGSWGEGLTVFNGSTWTTYTEDNSDIPNDDVRAIAVDHDDHIWIGTPFGDAGEYDGVNWTTYVNINYGYYSIYDIAVDSANRKWYISYMPPEQRIMIYDGEIWTPVAPGSSAGCDVIINGLAIGAGDVAWLPTLSEGLCRYDGTSWTRYHTGNSGITVDTLGPVIAAGSNVWVGFSVHGEGIDQFNGSTWQHIDTPDDLPDLIGAWGLAVDKQTWFGGYKGIYVYDGMDWSWYNSGNSDLADTGYDDIAEGMDGHLWFAGGNNGGGLVEFDRQTTWTQHSSGIGDSFVYALAVGGDGRVWAGSRVGLSVYNGIPWYTYNTGNSDLPNNKVEQIAIDGEGDIWVGPGCTTRFDGALWTTYATIEEAIQDNFAAIVNTIDEDPSCWVADEDMQRVWVSAGTGGVKYYNGSTWVAYSNSTMGFSPGTWYARLGGRDRAGNLWVMFLDQGAYHSGVSIYDGVSWSPYKRLDGVIETSGVYVVTFAHDGEVWVSGSKGFSLYSNPWQPVKKTIRPAIGGSLLSIDGSTQVVFPPGAVSLETTLIYTRTFPAPTGNLEGIDHFFDMRAVISGTMTPVTSFSQPFTVTVDYTEAELGSALENSLSLYSWNGLAWVQESSVRDTVLNQVTSTLDHLTHFAVLGETNRIYMPLLFRNW